MKPLLFSVLSLALILPACSTSPDPDRGIVLREQLDNAAVSLQEAIDLALAEASGDNVLGAELVMEGAPVFQVDVLALEDLTDVRVALSSGQVVSTVPKGSATFDCRDAIPLDDALAIAEQEANGDAIRVVPDDDVSCAYEIQILSDVTLIEVKVGPDGAVLEVEPSDEYSGVEDDD